MSNYDNHKKRIIEEVGKIDSCEQVCKGLEYINTLSPAYMRIMRSVLKKCWWDCHEYNKKSWSDLEWIYVQNKKRGYLKSTYKGDDLSHEDLNELVGICKSKKQSLFIMFLYKTGIRIGEMVKIELNDCKTFNKEINVHLIAEKSWLPLIKKVPMWLYKEIIKEFHGSKYLFETSGGKSIRPEYVSNQIKKQGKRIDKNISAVTLRRYYATNIINTNGIDGIKEALGHKTEGGFLSYYGGCI